MSLRFFCLFNEPVGGKGDSPEEQCREQGRNESLNHKSLDNGGHEPDHEGIDDKGKKTKCQDRDWKGKDKEEWTHKRIHKPKDKRSNERIVKRLDPKPRNHIRNHDQSNRIDHPTKENISHINVNSILLEN